MRAVRTVAKQTRPPLPAAKRRPKAKSPAKAPASEPVGVHPVAHPGRAREPREFAYQYSLICALREVKVGEEEYRKSREN